jgi:hypothetical protein
VIPVEYAEYQDQEDDRKLLVIPAIDNDGIILMIVEDDDGSFVTSFRLGLEQAGTLAFDLGALADDMLGAM